MTSNSDKRISSNFTIFLIAFSIFTLWSCLLTFSLFWYDKNLKNEKINLATEEAKANWNKDQAFRRWATKHGGLYVKPDERTQPNPYLSHLPNRDITTTDGVNLTLMNPASMMAQMTKEFEDSYGIKGKITGKKLLNPNNKADEWELKALTKFEQGENEVIEKTLIDNAPYLRYMKPMYMSEGCVNCHGILGFKVGDLRGGVSVSIPLTSYFSAAEQSMVKILYVHIIVWLVGLIGILSFTFYAIHKGRELSAVFKQLEHDALHDPLTGLPNRIFFLETLSHAMKRHQREKDYTFAVFFLDLNRFKNLNDSFGHQTGDKLLISLSNRFKKILRPTDLVARLGGDEFIFLIDEIKGLTEALAGAKRIQEELKQPCHIDGIKHFSKASLGICMANEHYSTPEDILRNADIAMYRAKKSSRDSYIDVFNPEMHEKAKKYMQLEIDLRDALTNEQMEVFYQPIVCSQKSSITGFEALLRWNHPTMGIISPDDFIPIAEETGLIIKIGQWVMEQACFQIREWNLKFNCNFFVSVNLSGIQIINTDLIPMIQETLKQTRLEPENLHCEVTETVLIKHQESSQKNINELQKLGIHLSIDDFGTGYCSLRYLQNYKFNTLKIDKAFVQDMGPDGKGLQLIRTILLLARDLNMQVIAEGVETQDQLGRLKALQCAMIQGYFFCKPQNSTLIEDMLVSDQHHNMLQSNQNTKIIPPTLSS